MFKALTSDMGKWFLVDGVKAKFIGSFSLEHLFVQEDLETLIRFSVLETDSYTIVPFTATAKDLELLPLRKS
jgi:hypothetical protein